MLKLNLTCCSISSLFSIFIFLFMYSHLPRIIVLVPMNLTCNLSRLESDDFFCETDEDWIRRKDIFHRQHNRNRFHDSIYLFFQDNYEPTFPCRYERRLGRNGDGGKWACDVYKLENRSNCLIYSLGSNGEFSFENATKQILPNCEIHTFDRRLFHCPNCCQFHQVKFGDGITPGTKTLRMAVNDLKHQQRTLDILKIDIEGSEYGFFEDVFHVKDYLSEHIHQILVEIHLSQIIRRVDNVTTIYDYEKIHRLFQLFHENNYVIFHKEVNLYNAYHTFEYSFVRLNKRFFL